VEKNGKYGFIDKTGKLVIGYQFNDAYGFSDGLAAVQVKDKWGFINKTGQYVITPRFPAVSSGFSEGFAIVYDDTGDHKFIDKTGAIVLPQLYNILGSFHEGLAAISNADYQTGFVDTTGAYVISPRFDSIGRGGFADGLAPVKVSVSMFGKMFGYTDKTGTLAFPAKFATAYSFSDGLARVLDDLIGGHWGFIDKTGEYVIPAQFEEVDAFSEGLAPVRLPDGKWGFIDKTGKWVIEPQFDVASPFSEGLASVGTAGNCGFIANPLGTPAPKDEPDSWAKAEVDAAIAAGLVPQSLQSGYKSNITREDFCALAVNLIVVKTGKPIETILAEKSLVINRGVFTDTQNDTVLAANVLGIVGGKGYGRFDPQGSITRQEAAAMLTRTAKVLGYSPSGQEVAFSDASSIQSWAKDAVSFISAAMDVKSNRAVMGGTGNNAFSPNGTYTRQQAFTTMIRLSNAMGQ
jgi:hypothetical protein